MGAELCKRGDELIEQNVVARRSMHADAAVDTTLARSEGDTLARSEGDTVASAIQRALTSAGPPISGTGVSQRVQRSAVVGEAGGPVAPDVERRIQSARGGGRPLPAPDRSMMEGALGVDLGSVRVHTGNVAADLNERVQAKAFTIGNDVFFRDGAPNTNTTEGQHLLAHELAHTMQRDGDVNRMIRRQYVVCPAKSAAKNSDFFEVDDPKAKSGKRKIFWKQQDAPRPGFEFKKAADQPSVWSWGTTSVYEENETAQHKAERLESERKQAAQKDEEKRVEKEEQRQAKENEQLLRQAQRISAEEARAKIPWFGAYNSAVDETHRRRGPAHDLKLSDEVVNAIDASLSKIAPAEEAMAEVWKRCLGHKMGSACTETSAAVVLQGRPAPDGTHGAPDKDIAKRVGQYLHGMSGVTKNVETFISNWCQPLDADADLLIAAHGTATEARTFIAAMGGVASYQTLRARHVTPATMQHYGTDWLRGFQGVTDGTMVHLTTAGISSGGDISGGHDAAAFAQFIVEHPAYSVTYTRTISPGVTVKSWSGPLGGGTKTVIDDLAAHEPAWKTKLSNAVWASIAAQTFPKVATGAITAFPAAIDGLRYKFFFDGSELSTLFPVGT